jgi:hypothetical protein
MSQVYGQNVPYAIADLVDDLPKADELISVVCTGTGIGLVAFMTGHCLHRQDLGYRDLGEISSLSMLSDPIVDEDTGFFESPGIKIKFTDAGKVPLLVAFGPRQPASWEAHFVSSALFDLMEGISEKPFMLSAGGFGVASKENMPEMVGRANGTPADEFMKAQGITKIDDIQKVDGIAKVLNAGQGFQAALPMLAIKRGIPSVFFLGTAVMSDHVAVKLDPEAVRHMMVKISDVAGLDLDYEKVDDFIKRESKQAKLQQRSLDELAKTFSRGMQAEMPDSTNIYI